MKRSKKVKFWIVAIMIFLLTVTSTILAAPTNVYASSQVSIMFNGRIVTFDQPAIIRNNRVMVPFRALFELLDAEIEWDPHTQQIFGRTDERSITLTIGNEWALVNGEQHFMDAPPIIMPATGRTLVPIRFVGETLGARVLWDPFGRTVCINT